MKKSIMTQNQSEPTTMPIPEHTNILKDILLSEGGISLLFILPAVVYFFLWAAIPSI